MAEESLSDIVAGGIGPSVHDLPEGEGDPVDAADDGDETGDRGEKPEPKPKAKTKPAPKVDDAETAEDEGDGIEPGDLKANGARKALQAERAQHKETKKRTHELELEVARLRGQVQAPKKETPAPDPKADLDQFYEDPAGYVRRQAQQVRQEAESLYLSKSLNASERRTKRANSDYDEAKAAFVAAAEREPWRWQPVFAEPEDGADIVYREGKKLLGGGEESELAKAQARIKELEAKLNGDEGDSDEDGDDEDDSNVTRIPTRSIAGARSSGSTKNTDADDEDDSLESIVARPRKKAR